MAEFPTKTRKVEFNDALYVEDAHRIQCHASEWVNEDEVWICPHQAVWLAGTETSISLDWPFLCSQHKAEYQRMWIDDPEWNAGERLTWDPITNWSTTT